MTDRINPQNQINFGGVRVNQNEIASKKVVKENGATRYIINFKNGTTIKYPAQAKKNEAKVSAYNESGPITHVNNLAYGKITGNTKDQDIIFMSGCKSCEVDVANDNLTDYVTLENSKRFKETSLFSQLMGNPSFEEEVIPSKNNKIKQDKNDLTEIGQLEISGEGVHIEGQE